MVKREEVKTMDDDDRDLIKWLIKVAVAVLGAIIGIEILIPN
jgi:hypothetical protein